MYRHFMDYVADEDIDLTDVSVSKSRLLTFHANSSCAPNSQPYDVIFLNRKVREVINHQRVSVAISP